MKKTMFYSLIEDGHLLRDHLTLLEGEQKKPPLTAASGEPEVNKEYEAKVDAFVKERDAKRAAEGSKEPPKAAEPSTPPKSSKPPKAPRSSKFVPKGDMHVPIHSGGKHVGYRVVNGPAYHKVYQANKDNPDALKQFLNKKEHTTVGLDSKTPMDQPKKGRYVHPETIGASTERHGKTLYGRAENALKGGSKFIKRQVGKVTDAAHSFGKSAKVRGYVGTALKHGIPAAAAGLVGYGLGANQTRKYVNSLPAVKTAKEWGPWIEHAKNYGPHVAAGAAGLWALNKLTKDD